MTQSILDLLTSVIAELLPSKKPRIRRGKTTEELSPSARQIAEEMLMESLRSGLSPNGVLIDKARLGGGNTAEIVAKVTLHAPFAFKLDQAKEKLAEEGETIRKIKTNSLPGINLPPRFRDVWPSIYSVRHEPPYAYLMEFFPEEDGWRSLENRLYPAGKGTPTSRYEALRWIGEVLNILFLGYESSVDTRHRPNLKKDYLGRIRDRLQMTAERDSRFASKELFVRGQPLRPWERYLDEIENHSSYLEQITPPFTTVTHGDPNPGNLMLRTTTSSVELKLIDPKEWMTGDYLFDLAKITHFLEATGPVEKPEQGVPVKAAFQENGETAELSYAYGRPEWTEWLVEACRERVSQFAARKESLDPHWEARYELGMAANLLGLPLGRLDKNPPREDAALILYGEGMIWLDRFCARLGAASGQSPLVIVARADEIEPEPLRRAREWVRKQVPGVSDATDRRGFQLLQWEPVRTNEGQKLAELSLEHEARLLTTDERAVMRLLDALSHSEGCTGGQHLLPEDSPFADLAVHRYEREAGAQSVDRYYDVSTAVTRLIPRQITLRERIKTSKFMTWSSANPNLRPLNLELPFVALGRSGMTARLEFNWVDDLEGCLREALAKDTPEAERSRNPFHLAMQLESVALEGLAPVLEHTTFRQKFGLRPLGSAEDSNVLVVNVDTVIAQDLETKRIGTYWDVDISGTQFVDKAGLKRVADFAEVLAQRYGLNPNPGSKAWRDAQVTGLLDRWKGS